jgi:hypothetical protein
VSPPGHVARLYRSGELHRAAVGCATGAELAQRLGLTADALDRALRRMRDADPSVPTSAQIVNEANRLGRERSLVDGGRFLVDRGDIQEVDNGDEWEVEKTSPDVAPVIEAVRAYDGKDKFQERDVKLHGPSLGVKNRAEALEAVEEHRLKRRVAELETANRELLDRLANTQDMLGIAREAAQHRVKPLDMRERTSGRREAASLILISDNHVDEVVTADSVNGLNEHNPDVARARMARVFQGASWLTNHARQSHLVRDVVVCLLGDHISGTIHQDLSETNAMSLPESIAFAQQLIGDGLRHLLSDPETETIRVICSTGNHGRLAPGKPRIHTRNETNAETILFVSLAREFASDPRISFDLPSGVFSYFQIYGKTCRASHGDHLKYSGALGGLTNPINRAIARMNQARHADLDVFGHWHTLFDGGAWIVNGSTVGYGPFSEWIHCPYERPQQGWALLDSRRWRSLNAPIWCDEADEAREAA